jgi:hypothetical protein
MPEAVTVRFKVTVQVVEALDAREEGLQEIDETVSLYINVNETCSEEPFREAVRVADWVLVTAPAVAEKVMDVAPPSTLTEGGTVR